MSASPNSAELAKLAQIAMDLGQSNKVAADEIQRFIIAVQRGQTPPTLPGNIVALVQAQGVSIPNIVARVASQNGGAGGADAPTVNPMAGAQQSEANNSTVANVNSPTSPLPPTNTKPGTAPTAPVTTTATPPVVTNPTPNRGPATGAQDIANADPSMNTLSIQNAMRSAGLNPNRTTAASAAAMRGLAPILGAARAVYGQEAGAQAGGLTDFINGLAQKATQGGSQTFFGDLQKYAQGVLNGPTFQGGVNGLTDSGAQYAAYQNLLPLLYAGSNGLFQQAAGDQAAAAYGDFNYADSQQAAPGNQLFNEWLATQGNNMTPIQRSIFGGGR